MNRYRPNEICVSDEVLFLLRLRAKRVVSNTDASCTFDQVADNILRKELTTENPDDVLKWESMLEARQQAKKRYEEIESI